MKRLITAILAVMLTAALVSPAAAASPSGRGAHTVRYQTQPYFDFILGAVVVCKGIHQWGPQWPGDATSGGREIYRCRSQSGPFTNVHHGDRFVYPAFSWFSDYFAEQGGFAINTQPIRVVMAGNNLSYHAVAIYY